MRTKFTFQLLIVLFFAGSLFYTTPAFSKDGYSIKIKIKELKDTVCYLANYYGDKQYMKDTARTDASGNFSFEGSENLPGGIYLVVVPGKKYFEVLIDKEQQFSLTTDTVDMVKHMVVKGSEDNKMFYEYMLYINDRQKQAEPLSVLQKTISKDNKDSIALIKGKLNALETEVKSYKTNFIKDHPGSFLSVIFKSSSDPEIPEIPTLADGKKDSTFSYKYYKAHFWDNIDFKDDRILRTPIFHSKLKQYMQSLTVQVPDSLNKEADYVIEKARVNKELFKYCIWYVTFTYETSKQMGMDAVFVHMAEKYYMANEAYWADSTTIAKISERAIILKPLLIGKKAPALMMKDTLGNMLPLSSIKNKYTILFFWDPECGHCKKTAPLLLETYHKIKSMDVEVYAVCTETEPKPWKKFINEHKLDWVNVADIPRQTNFKKTYDITSTPVIYILDSKKEIIAKKIGVENIEDIIKRDSEKNL